MRHLGQNQRRKERAAAGAEQQVVAVGRSATISGKSYQARTEVTIGGNKPEL